MAPGHHARVDFVPNGLTHQGRWTHVWVSKLGHRPLFFILNNGQATIQTNTDTLSNGPLGTNFNEIWINIQFLYTNLQITSRYLGLDILKNAKQCYAIEKNRYTREYAWNQIMYVLSWVTFYALTPGLL